MKKNKSILIFFTFLIAASCTENEKSFYPNLPYFEFKTEDTPNLLNLPELNARLTFINQNNEELYFDVVKSEKGMQLYSTGSFVYGSTKYFYYDEQQLFLRSTLFDIDDTHSYLEISVRRFPIKFNDGRNGQPRVISKESKININIRIAPFNNNRVSHIYLDSNLPTANMNINGVVYTKVLKLNIAGIPISSNWSTPTLTKIYYDKNHGLIGFNDINNNEWRLK